MRKSGGEREERGMRREGRDGGAEVGRGGEKWGRGRRDVMRLWGGEVGEGKARGEGRECGRGEEGKEVRRKRKE